MANENETVEVQKEATIESLNDFMSLNAQCTSEIVNDRKLTPMERMKGLTLGVRNQAVLSRDQQNRITMLSKLGMKANDVTKTLSFQPGE